MAEELLSIVRTVLRDAKHTQGNTLKVSSQKAALTAGRERQGTSSAPNISSSEEVEDTLSSL